MRWLKGIVLWVLNTLFPGNEIEEEIRRISKEDFGNRINVKSVDNTTYLLNYRDPIVRKMIWMLKYRGDKHVSALFSAMLDDYLLEEISEIRIFDKSDIILMPIPIHRTRYRSRGFNQIELVLKNLQNDYTIDTKSLIKSKNTKPQTEIKNKNERMQNIVGTFTVSNPDGVKNKHVILIDDVVTTGSTLREAEETLLENGAKNVECIAFAH